MKETVITQRVSNCNLDPTPPILQNKIQFQIRGKKTKKKVIFYANRDQKKKTPNLIEKSFLFLIINTRFRPMLKQMTLSRFQQDLRQLNLQLTNNPTQNHSKKKNATQSKLFTKTIIPYVPVRRSEGGDSSEDSEGKRRCRGSIASRWRHRARKPLFLWLRAKKLRSKGSPCCVRRKSE